MSAHTPSLPSRYEPYEKMLAARLEEAARTAAAGGAPVARPSAARRAVWVCGAVLAFATLVFLTSAGSASRSDLPAARGTLFSAQLAGAATRPEDFVVASLPSPAVATAPAPIALGAETPMGTTDRGIPEPPTRHAPRLPARLESVEGAPDRRAQSTEVLFDESTAGELIVPPAQREAPATLNVGDRVRASLDDTLETRVAGSPVAARVIEDVTVDGQVVVPAGSRLVGEAFAISEDDRLQVVFTALVRGGRTIQMSGLALGSDGRVGLPAKVLRKASKGKRGFGRVLGMAGATLSAGLLPLDSDLASIAARQAVSEAARELAEVGGHWTRSDKVLQAPAGSITVYLRADLVLP